MNNNFLEFILSNYYDQLFSHLDMHIRTHKDLIKPDKENLIGINHIEVYEPDFCSVNIERLDNTHIRFYVKARPEIYFTEVVGKYHDHEDGGRNDLYFTIICEAKIDKIFSDFKIIEVTDEFLPYPKHSMNGSLIPVISAKEYENYADEILEQYYPEALTKKAHVDPNELAKRLGFSIIERRISRDKNIFGQIYYKCCIAELFNDELNKYEKVDIHDKTIIIDTEANNNYSYGSKNITIAHECVHAYLHKMAFDFAQILDKNNKFHVSCSIYGEADNVSYNDDYKFIEIQANGIAPCLLLPRDQLRSVYFTFTDGLKFVPDSPSKTEAAVEAIKVMYEVTYYAAKKRLIDMGYHEVAGVYNFIDGKFVKPFYVKKESLKNGETYVISINDVIKLLNDPNSTLLSTIIKDDYIFVENHLCINHPKYVQLNDNGLQELTTYARLNMDECCLKFKLSSNQRTNADVLAFCYLSRETKCDLVADLKLVNTKKTLSAEVAGELKKYNDDIQALSREIAPLKFNEAIAYILKNSTFQLKNLPNCDLTTTAEYQMIERYKRNEGSSKPKKETVVKICYLLQVPPVISNILIYKAGIVLTNDDEDMFYNTLLTICRGKSPVEINTFAEQYGIHNFIKIE